MIVEPLVLHYDRKTILPGLREAISSIPPKPPEISFAEYTALPSADRDVYDQARHDYLLRTLRVSTPEQDLCTKILARLIASNPRRQNSRRGLMISAPLYFGKTELALLLSRSIEQDHAARHPGYAENGDVPVVWLEMTQNATGKSPLTGIIEFLAPTVALPKQISTDRLLRMALDLLSTHRTKLLVVDEAHHLGGAEPSSIIKALQNQSSATIVLVGINLGSGKAFGTGHGLQVTMRCELVELPKIDIGTDEGLALWRRWVAIFDRNLPLCEHAPGTLTRNAAALHKAAGGQLAVLAQIIERLIDGILDDASRGDEHVTRQRLFDVLDGLRRTTPVRHKLTLDDLLEAA